jgi:hypothetical protein
MIGVHPLQAEPLHPLHPVYSCSKPVLESINQRCLGGKKQIPSKGRKIKLINYINEESGNSSTFHILSYSNMTSLQTGNSDTRQNHFGFDIVTAL